MMRIVPKNPRSIAAITTSAMTDFFVDAIDAEIGAPCDGRIGDFPVTNPEHQPTGGMGKSMPSEADAWVGF
jgi:hypothetical protein